VVVLWLGLSLLLSVSKHNIWSYYGWVCRCCHLSVNTIYGHIMVGFVVVVVLVNTIYGRIMIGLSLSSVSKHNIWSYYDWVVVCRPSNNPIMTRPYILCLLTNKNNNKSNHNTTTYYVY
jgi:hypothetical protein